ncbi:hypothetical protein [Paracoccus thiocyanatus]|uniref:hypothetical protein n=1 Tax=Paracoccus thiocyanatus TaxID=34006 RepID=UPI002161B36F|nr:hypothetical protein [Paracoccus thiocyanatus]
MLKIGFFIPEFPGQTHIFLWRERQALAELGIDAEPVSTRPPPRAVASHSWAAEAQAQTRYLMPLGGEGLGAVAEFLRAGPRRLDARPGRCDGRRGAGRQRPAADAGAAGHGRAAEADRPPAGLGPYPCP